MIVCLKRLKINYKRGRGFKELFHKSVKEWVSAVTHLLKAATYR